MMMSVDGVLQRLRKGRGHLTATGSLLVHEDLDSGVTYWTYVRFD